MADKGRTSGSYEVAVECACPAAEVADVPHSSYRDLKGDRMKSIISIVALLTLISPANSLLAKDGDEEVVAKGKVVAQQLFDGNYDEIRKQLSNMMKEKLTVDLMKQTMDQVRAGAGKFNKMTDAKPSKTKKHQMVDVRCDCDEVDVNVRVAYDGEGKIDGLWVTPIKE
jgi:hypothetical protein